MTNISSFYKSYSNYSYNTQNTNSTTSTSTSTSTSSSAVTEKDLQTQLAEFEKFKAENYKEVDAIISSSSSKWSSGSIEVTAGALLRMQNDPEFKDEMMRLLQEDADNTHNWTTSGESYIKIDENGYTGHSQSFLGDDLTTEQAQANADFTSSLFGENTTNSDEVLDKDHYKLNQNQSLIKKMQEAMDETKKAQQEKSEKTKKEKVEKEKSEKLEKEKTDKSEKLEKSKTEKAEKAYKLEDTTSLNTKYL